MQYVIGFVLMAIGIGFAGGKILAAQTLAVQGIALTVLGFVITVIGLILMWAGITGKI